MSIQVFSPFRKSTSNPGRVILPWLRRRLATVLLGGCLLPLLAGGAAFARKAPAKTEELSPAAQQVLDSAIAREHELLATLKQYKPLAETYLQEMSTDKELGLVPVRDRYFLLQLDLERQFGEHSFMKPPSRLHRLSAHLSLTSAELNAPGLIAQPMVIDARAFDREHYKFKFAGREFLGSVRTLIFDVEPRPHSGRGRFVGRVWIEDIDHNIVRFNGVYRDAPLFTTFLHFDSWRTNVKGGLWLPSYVYLEESDLPAGFKRLHLKGITNIWGYGLEEQRKRDELTEVLVDSTVEDRSDSAQDYSPLQRQRAWEREAENNVIQRLQKAGLIAPPGPVDQILQTVINNLEITNNLTIEPEVHARVLLTSPMESFTIGHTIVLSRGLIDVLPDEASLAMVLAHELAHISLGHRLDTKYAFDDRMLFRDYESLRRFQLKRDPAEEDAADVKAMTFLQQSPYAGKLNNAGLFLRALEAQAPQLTSLVSPHYGNRMMKGRELKRMAQTMQGAPALHRADPAQMAALPLGSRVKVDVWDAHIDIMKSTQPRLLSARDKMPFEVTPAMQNLTRRDPVSQQALRLTPDGEDSGVAK